MNLVNYFENPEIQDVNAEKARAYFVPFKNLDEVREVSKLLQDKPQTDIRQLSDSLQFLNGDWYFLNTIIFRQFYTFNITVKSHFTSSIRSF